MNTAHFKISELSCKCCGKTKPNTELLAVLELLRVTYNAPVIINSGYRCPTHNKAVGGVSNSQHVKGTAADVVVKGFDPLEVYHFLDSIFPECYGLGLYVNDGFVHIDTRSRKARWEK